MSDDIKLENADESAEDFQIVSVVDEDGEEHIFEELDIIELDDKEYVALLPIYDDDEVFDDDGELIILERSYDEDGEIYLEPIENEAEFMKIGKMFEERLSDIFEFDDEE